EMFLLGAVNDPGGNFLDPLTEAYWVPYVPIGTQGTGIAGVPYVDVPAANPPKKYVFTGSMNGCSLVVTDAPVGGQIRIHHDSAHGATTFNGMNLRVRLDYAGNTHNSPFSYGDVTQGNDIATSWNFFYYNGNNWVLVSQPQVFVPGAATPGVKLNPAKAPFQTVVP
ncbi:MAG TPA: hypothetical protein VMB71_15910, partial [Acetobacteraceae bacterium]|nr:hypothetical protein [Acetobacteraceae bacterium]